jgi:glycine C-acetyltransferase/8-amino-7-oxononanoate synthase
MRLVSGPPGPRVVLDGRPVTVLSSANYLGLADHPRVREAAADAALRWGASAGAARQGCGGTLLIHRRLEERLATFLRSEAVLLAGSGYLGALAAVTALGRAGVTILVDELACPALADACRLARGRTVPYRHADAEQVAWELQDAAGRGPQPALVVTEAVFARDGDVAPLGELCEAVRRGGARLLVDESHALGCMGPGARGALAEAGLDGEADVVISSLGTALGSFGGVIAGDAAVLREIESAGGALAGSAAPSPPASAAAFAALALVGDGDRRLARLQANAGVLRDALAREGLPVTGSDTHVMALAAHDEDAARRMSTAALEEGVVVEAVDQPPLAEGAARVRIAVMATHAHADLGGAAQALGRAARRAGLDVGIHPGPSRTSGRAGGIFDVEARLAA